MKKNERFCRLKTCENLKKWKVVLLKQCIQNQWSANTRVYSRTSCMRTLGIHPLLLGDFKGLFSHKRGDKIFEHFIRDFKFGTTLVV